MLDTDVLLLGLASIVWAVLMVGNRLLGPSRTVRRVLYAGGAIILAYALAHLAGWT